MNQNLATYTYATEPAGSQQQQQVQQAMTFSTYHQPATYTTSTTGQYPNNGTPFSSGLVQQNRPAQTLRLQPVDPEERKISTLLDSGHATTYFIEASTSGNWNTGGHSQTIQTSQSLGSSGSLQTPQLSYQNGQLITTTPGLKVQSAPELQSLTKMIMSPDKAEKERMKKARQAEAARLRYHRLTPEEKRELNLKRTLAQKRKRQREKELEELETILRETNDIQEDPDITEQLREKRMRAKWAEAARARYARMTPDERRAHNNRRRMRQMQNALAAVRAAGGSGDAMKDEEAVKQHIKNLNAKKAEAARMRYHRMTEEEKRIYNQRRTEAFRRRRMEEEMLLAMPIGRINGEALDRAQQIVVRNAKRAEAARARYQRMTPDQRKNYNQKRYTPKRRIPSSMGGDMLMLGSGLVSSKKEEVDALTTLEREVMKRTQQAQQALVRQGQQRAAASGLLSIQTPGTTQQPSTSNTYIVQQTPVQVTHLGSQQILAPSSNSGHQQVHLVSHPMQQIQTQQGHTIITQSQAVQGYTTLPTSQGQHVVVQHTPSSVGSGHVIVQHQPTHQVTYSTNNMMISGQHVQQQSQPPHSQSQVINPYGAPQRN